MKIKYEIKTERLINMIDDCLENAAQLSKASIILVGQGLHAPSVSLSVIALEELAKIILLDNVINYKAGDGKIKLFFKESENHSIKLDILEYFRGYAALLKVIAAVYGGEKVKSVEDINKWQHLRDNLEDILKRSFKIVDLDKIKQSGFYVDLRSTPRSPIPSKIIDSKFAEILADFTEQTSNILSESWDFARSYYSDYLDDIRLLLENNDIDTSEAKSRFKKIEEEFALITLSVESIFEEFLEAMPEILRDNEAIIMQQSSVLGVSREVIDSMGELSRLEGRRRSKVRRYQQLKELENRYQDSNIKRKEDE